MNRKAVRNLTKREISSFQKTLSQQRSNILDNSRRDKLQLHTSADDRADEADLASSDTDQGMRARLGNRENLYLKKVNEALARILQNEYGECTSCSNPIGIARLTARPTAELCIQCKEEEEKLENTSVHAAKHKSLGAGLGVRMSSR